MTMMMFVSVALILALAGLRSFLAVQLEQYIGHVSHRVLPINPSPRQRGAWAGSLPPP
jgi:hypothetical protein